MNKTDLLYYFAYGSNMSIVRLKSRLGNVELISTAMLAGHDLRFHKVGGDGSGKCDAFETSSELDYVWGGLYQISSGQKTTLDKIEGLGFGYELKNILVTCANGQRFNAITYVATDIDKTIAPYTWYYLHVLAGAKVLGLPNLYVAKKILSHASAALVDPDRERTLQNLIFKGDTKLVRKYRYIIRINELFVEHAMKYFENTFGLFPTISQSLKITLQLFCTSDYINQFGDDFDPRCLSKYAVNYFQDNMPVIEAALHPIYANEYAKSGFTNRDKKQRDDLEALYLSKQIATQRAFITAQSNMENGLAFTSVDEYIKKGVKEGIEKLLVQGPSHLQCAASRNTHAIRFYNGKNTLSPLTVAYDDKNIEVDVNDPLLRSYIQNAVVVFAAYIHKRIGHFNIGEFLEAALDTFMRGPADDVTNNADDLLAVIISDGMYFLRQDSRANVQNDLVLVSLKAHLRHDILSNVTTGKMWSGFGVMVKFEPDQDVLLAVKAACGDTHIYINSRGGCLKISATIHNIFAVFKDFYSVETKFNALGIFTEAINALHQLDLDPLESECVNIASIREVMLNALFNKLLPLCEPIEIEAQYECDVAIIEHERRDYERDYQIQSDSINLAETSQNRALIAMLGVKASNKHLIHRGRSEQENIR